MHREWKWLVRIEIEIVTPGHAREADIE